MKRKSHARNPGVPNKPLTAPVSTTLFESSLARGLLHAMFQDIEDTFHEFYQELMQGIPGDKSLERASAIFQMNEAKLLARHRAWVSTAEIELEWRKIELQKALDLAEMQGKAGMHGPGVS